MKHRTLALTVLIVATLLPVGLTPITAVQPHAQVRIWGGADLRTLPFEVKPLRPLAVTASSPGAITPAPLIQEMIDRVDSTTVMSYTGSLSGEWPVMIGGEPYTITTRNTSSGEPIRKAIQYIGEHLAALGLAVEYQDWTKGEYSSRNVIGELTGEAHPEEIFILCAHLDDKPDGAIAPGADDNASGSAAVLMAADILTHYRWDCTLRFALWTGEEQGMLGSKAYAQRAHDAGENIVSVLNLDMIAWNTQGSDPGMDLHADSALPATLHLANLFASVVDAYDLNLIPQIVPNGTRASDHASFWNFGYPAILGIEDFGDFNPYYHTVADTRSTLDKAFFTELVKASVGTLAHTSDCLLQSYYIPLVVRDMAGVPSR